MTKQVVKINIWDPGSVSKALDELNRFQKHIDILPQKIVTELARRGLEIAQYQFDNAVYAGTNDTIVYYKLSNNGKQVTFYAEGQSVLFIEFGAGVFKDSALEEVMNITSGSVLAHGEYGKGKGANPGGWVYTGDIGENHPDDTTYVGSKGAVRTMGNHANSSMWETRKALVRILDEVVREVLND